MSSKSFFSRVVVFVSVLVNVSTSVAKDYDYPQLLSKEQLLSNRNILGGTYCTYPYGQELQPVEAYTPAPKGYTPFYISHYGRHGSRYQPNDKRYTDTRDRLRDAHAKGVLTSMGEDLLKRVDVLCDSCIGHGGMLTTLGALQEEAIARRMYRNFPEVFNDSPQQTKDAGPARQICISARASIVPRCGQTMQAFIKGLNCEADSCNGKPLDINAEVNKAYMSYISYDTPQMRQLSGKMASWQSGYNAYMLTHVDRTPFIRRIYSDATGIDTLQTAIDLFWLTIGMQDLYNMPFNLDDVFTAEELFACWQCFNYRMYICNANSPLSDNIPAESASTLLKNIVESADSSIISNLPALSRGRVGRVASAATLRFGHDSNFLRLLALMRIHHCANRADDVKDGWKVWQEGTLCPMAANLQIVFYHNEKAPVLVKILLNEHEVLLDVPSLRPISTCYYSWNELRQFFLSQIKDDSAKTEFREPVQ